MNNGTLIVVAVLLGGVVLMILLGCLNPFVPRKYQKMVRTVHRTQIGGGGKEIPIRMRYDSSAYLGVSVILVVGATVVCLLASRPLGAFFARGFWPVLGSICFWILIISVMEVVYIVAAFLAETMVIQSEEKYYSKFGFKAVDTRLADIRS